MKEIRCVACTKLLTKRSAVAWGAAMGGSKFCHIKCYPALWAMAELQRPGSWIAPREVMAPNSVFRVGAGENLRRVFAGEELL